jgi:hypothetical protein
MKARLRDLQGALDGLPDQNPKNIDNGQDGKRSWGTGTDDARTEAIAIISTGKVRGQSNGKTVQNLANDGEAVSNVTGEVDKAQVFTLARNENRQRTLAKRGAARIRTGDGGFAIRCLSRLATAPYEYIT